MKFMAVVICGASFMRVLLSCEPNILLHYWQLPPDIQRVFGDGKVIAIVCGVGRYSQDLSAPEALSVISNTICSAITITLVTGCEIPSRLRN
jgi:hypothetical protein